MRKLLALVIVCLSFYSKSQSICSGASFTLQAGNPQNLTAPLNYSLLAGGFTSPSGSFVVTPSVTTTYTLITSGTNSLNLPATTSAVVTVTVYAQPVSVPSYTQASCTNTSNLVNLNLTFIPSGGPAPNYSVTWGGQAPAPTPPNILSPQQTTFANVPPGTYTAIITTADGCVTTKVLTMTPQPAPPSFSILPLGTNFSITCAQPTLNLSVSVPVYSYTWASANVGLITGTSVAITNTAAGSWSIVCQHPQSGCTSVKFFTVGINTTPPISAITPSVQNVTCTTVVSPVTMSSNIGVNITHYVYTSQGGTFAFNTQTAVFVPPPSYPTHTYVLVDLANGCSVQKTFAVIPAVGIPIFTIQSIPGGYTLGCSSKSFITVSVPNPPGPITTPFPGAPVSYTLLAPNASSVLPNAGNLSNASSYTINTPGTWTFVVRDNGNTCDSRLPFTVLQNTIGPLIDSISAPQTVLTCFTPSIVIQGWTEAQGVTAVWNFSAVGNPSVSVTSFTLPVISNSNAALTSSVVNIYTVTMTDGNSLCRSSQTIQINQNLYPPKTFISATNGGSITCKTNTVLLTNSSQSGVPANVNYPKLPLPSGLHWFGPSPQLPLDSSSTYVGTIAGTYTLVGQDPTNGCTSSNTFVLFGDQRSPIIDPPVKTPTIDCGNINGTIVPIYTPTSGLTYTWTPPVASATLSSKFTPSITATSVGVYTVVTANINNGCTATLQITMGSGSLFGTVDVDRVKGYAPLTVNFANNVLSSINNESITTAWSFGNGTSSVTASASIIPVTTYNLPGTYTVTAFHTKRPCTYTTKHVIEVELPSELVVPNVFTPNGDDINDVFILKATNLSSVYIKIFDRWGHIVYELTTEKGQVEWDGKTQYGKEAPEGTYYYTIKATGKDDVSYEKKGTINLLR